MSFSELLKADGFFLRKNRFGSVALLQGIVNGLASSRIYILLALKLTLVLSIVGIVKNVSRGIYIDDLWALSKEIGRRMFKKWDEEEDALRLALGTISKGWRTLWMKTD